MNIQMIKTELYKLFSKKIIWISMCAFMGLFLFLRIPMMNKIGVKYTLEPLRSELSQTVSNENFHKFIRENNYNCPLDEMTDFIPKEVFEYIEKYRDNERIYTSLKNNLRTVIINYFEKTDTRAEYINNLAEDIDKTANVAEYKAKSKLLSELQNSDVKIELNLENSANNFIDVNHSMVFPCSIMLVILIGIAGIYSDEYTSGTQSILLTSKNGRSGVFFSKFFAAVIFIVFIVLIMESFFILVTAIVFHAPKNEITAASTYQFYLTTYSGTVSEFCLRQIGGTILSCFTLSCIVMAISIYSKNSLIPFFTAGIYYGGTALYANMIEFPKYLSKIHSVAGEFSLFMLQTQVELTAEGHYTNCFGMIVPTISASIIFNVILSLVSLAFCYKGYTRKQVIN